MLSADEIERLIPAETARFCSPIPTPSVSSDEFMAAALARAEYDLHGQGRSNLRYGHMQAAARTGPLLGRCAARR